MSHHPALRPPVLCGKLCTRLLCKSSHLVSCKRAAFSWAHLLHVYLCTIAAQIQTNNRGCICHLLNAGQLEPDFLLRIAAAEKACSMMPASKSHILGSFDRAPAPVSFCTWLQQQPRSMVVQGCLDALKHSPLQLTQHLLAR